MVKKIKCAWRKILLMNTCRYWWQPTPLLQYNFWIQDVYMGEPAGEDSQYCALDAGVLISNSVLRSIHAELEWCVRNSYSPHHHENLGRCVLHAAHVPCSASVQGETYRWGCASWKHYVWLKLHFGNFMYRKNGVHGSSKHYLIFLILMKTTKQRKRINRTYITKKEQ